MRLNKEMKDLLIAMSIGDGYINRKGYLHILHTLAQKEYIEYKYELIRNLCKSGIKTYQVKEHRLNRTYYKCYFTTRINSFLKALRKVLYPDGNKVISRRILNRIDERGLAIWWMDDGCRSPQYRNGKVHSVNYILSTHLTKEENQVIVDWFVDKWGIKPNIIRQRDKYVLIFHTRDGRKFSDIVRPYIIPSMQYKINPVDEVGNSSKKETLGSSDDIVSSIQKWIVKWNCKTNENVWLR
jgi:ribosomal protein S24E